LKTAESEWLGEFEKAVKENLKTKKAAFGGLPD